MDSQKMAQNFNYDAEIGDLRDQIGKLKSENRQQSARIRELEEVVEGMLYEVKRTISPELREKAEKALNKKERS